MNLIEAHKIVHDYMQALATPPEENSLFYRPISHLKNTKDEIVDAYKLFYAHMLLFGTRSQKQYQQYEIGRKFLSTFVRDEKYQDVIKCMQVINDGPPQDNSLSFCKEKIKIYLTESAALMAHPYRGEEVEAYFARMQQEKAAIEQRWDAGRQTEGRLSLRAYFLGCSDYCKKAYQAAGLPMQPTDAEYFYPFEIMRELLQNPGLADIFSPYEEYILQNR